MFLTLEDNLVNVQSSIGPVQNLLPRCRHVDNARTRKHLKKSRRQFQSKVYAALHKQSAPNVHARFDWKLHRWGLHDSSKPLHNHLSVIQRTPNWQARCAHQRLKALAQLVAPRVHAAVFSAIWNRWCTLRRFQTRGNCRLCNSRHTEDSIEHYVFCSAVREVATRRLRLNISRHVNIHTFTCTNPLLDTEELLTRAALLIYATYRALNHQRQAPIPLRGEELYHAMCQWIIEGARGNTKCCRSLARIWTDAAGKRLAAIR